MLQNMLRVDLMSSVLNTYTHTHTHELIIEYMHIQNNTTFLIRICMYLRT